MWKHSWNHKTHDTIIKILKVKKEKKRPLVIIIKNRAPCMYIQWNTMLCYAKSFQSCPTLCDPIDGSPPGSPVPGILQATTPEWAAISFSNTWKWKVKGKSLSRVWLLATPWTAAHQAPPSVGFSGQEYWSGVPLPSPSEYNTNKKKPQIHWYRK